MGLGPPAQGRPHLQPLLHFSQLLPQQLACCPPEPLAEGRAAAVWQVGDKEVLSPKSPVPESRVRYIQKCWLGNGPVACK